MMKEYDFLFIQNAPAFYKINLFNALAQNFRVGVVFLGESDQVVMDKDTRNWKFDAYYLNIADVEHTNIIKTLAAAWRMRYFIKSMKYRYVVYGGWTNMEFVIMMFTLPRERNCVISESCIYESTTTGVKGFIKRQIVNRNAHAFVSGEPHKLLMTDLNYRGKVHVTGGVGLALRHALPIHNIEKKRALRFVYTGRIIEIKNLELLIKAFNENGKLLTIIGKGEKEAEYKAMSKDNIEFIGFVDNSKLKDIYMDCDCLILPSNTEPWGLVVEEALYNGMPVIVSDMVGCNVDMVKNYDSGVIFNHKSVESLQFAISDMENNFQRYKKNALSIDWEKRDKEQIESFSSIVKL